MKHIREIVSILLLLCVSVNLSGCHGVGDKSMSITTIYGATVVLSLLVLIAYFALIRKKNLWYCLLFSSVPVVNIGYQWLSASTTLNSALWANRLSYLGSVFLPMAMLMIILNSAKLPYKKWVPWALLVLAVIIFAIAGSPGFSDLYYKEVSLQTVNGVTILDKVYGVLHPLFLFYLLGYFAAMVAAIIQAAVKKTVHSNAHAVILAVAVFVNIGVWLLEQLSRIDFEFLSVSYIISELFLLGLEYVFQENPVKDSKEELPEQSDSADTSPTSAEILEAYKKGLCELTRTERLVYDLYIEGKSTKEVLAVLGIKENTLKYHNRNIYGKLGISSRKQLREIAAMLNEE